MNKRHLALFLSVLAMLIVFAAANVQAQNKTGEEAEKKAGQGITFKIPDKVMPMPWQDFKGVLMLYQKQPGGMFISYPNENESLDDLKKRAEKFIANMFVHDEKKAGELQWQVKSVPSHRGDKGESAVMKLYDGEKEALQITFYEREWNGLSLIYGYFARKSKTSKDKDDSADFLDDKGEGSKKFDEFRKTFPNR
jgi:hypothetical protein